MFKMSFEEMTASEPRLVPRKIANRILEAADSGNV